MTLSKNGQDGKNDLIIEFQKSKQEIRELNLLLSNKDSENDKILSEKNKLSQKIADIVNILSKDDSSIITKRTKSAIVSQIETIIESLEENTTKGTILMNQNSLNDFEIIESIITDLRYVLNGGYDLIRVPKYERSKSGDLDETRLKLVLQETIQNIKNFSSNNYHELYDFVELEIEKIVENSIR